MKFLTVFALVGLFASTESLKMNHKQGGNGTTSAATATGITWTAP